VRLEGVVFLAADTLRSRAYAQAMEVAGISLDDALLVKSVGLARWGQAENVETGNSDFGDIFVPDLSIPLEETLPRLCRTTKVTQAGTVNDSSVTDWIESTSPELVFFSGFGGEIVGRALLNTKPPLLHIHSGWLPDYRGSTTIYYSYLRQRSCGVSAFLLRETIDTGPIVSRRRYPSPPPGADVDYYYDSAIRADLLVHVLLHWGEHGRFPNFIKQSSGSGITYFIIHPVLKHIALNMIHRSG